MKAKIICVLLLAITTLMAYGQRPTLELTFTAVDSTAYIQMDSIKVMNRTQGGDTVLYWPDTVLSIYYVGIHDPEQQASGFQVYQNYPNPVTDQTTISLYVPERDYVSMSVTDLSGRFILKSDLVLDHGTHSFRFTPGRRNLYFFTAQWRGMSSGIKILQAAPHSNGTVSIEYTGSEISTPKLKALEEIQDFSFSPGDELLYIGHANGLQSGMLSRPEESKTYTFQFATNIPCPGTPTVEYEGQVYNTIQIFSQCWLKENLNVGAMVQGTEEMTDNGIMEKYCYENEPDSCTKYGGLYQWDEIMQYVTQQGVLGICPPGWHLPTDEEWKVLEGAVDSQYGIGDQIWEIGDRRGYDAGTNLKTTSNWYYGGNGTDLFGFAGLPGGCRYNDGTFNIAGFDVYWWTSSEESSDYAWGRMLEGPYPDVYRIDISEVYGFSVRCLRD